PGPWLHVPTVRGYGSPWPVSTVFPRGNAVNSTEASRPTGTNRLAWLGRLALRGREIVATAPGRDDIVSHPRPRRRSLCCVSRWFLRSWLWPCPARRAPRFRTGPPP